MKTVYHSKTTGELAFGLRDLIRIVIHSYDHTGKWFPNFKWEVYAQ